MKPLRTLTPISVAVWRTGETTTYSMTIERPRSGTVVKIADTANAMEDDQKFELYMDLGEGRTMHTRAMEADDDGNVVEEVVIVRTDIAAPKAVAFAKFVDAMGMTIQVLDANPKTESGMDYQSLDIVPANLAMIATDGITATGAGTITVPAAMEDNTNTADIDETVAAFETDVTFNGSSGKLRCTGDTDCTVTLDAEGKITEFSAENWIFTPDPKVTTGPDGLQLLVLRLLAEEDDGRRRRAHVRRGRDLRGGGGKRTDRHFRSR